VKVVYRITHPKGNISIGQDHTEGINFIGGAERYPSRFRPPKGHKGELGMALLSKGRMSKMMLDILLKLTPGTKSLKENIIVRLGLIGQMSATRDINAAWDETKRNAAKLYPDKFILDKRNVLQWNDGSFRVLDEKISSANFKRLNELAETENCSVDALVTKLIGNYKHQKKK
jgi:hypothetical protein